MENNKCRAGIVFGCFIPLHIGHISIIQRAIVENEDIYIVVCGHKGDRGDAFIPFEDREKLMKNYISTHYAPFITEHIHIISVDDAVIHPDGDYHITDWEAWIKEFFRVSEASTYDTYMWYTGEPDYIRAIHHVRHDDKFIIFDRSYIPISGTMIRENIDEYREYVADVYLQYLEERNLV